MLKYQFVVPKSFIVIRFYSLKTSTEKLKSYQSTVLLPKTNFPSYLKPKEVVERDKRIQQEAKFLDFYNWQRENLKGEFILHDGPPYANGKPHIGHAVNKVLKDIILRSQVIQGKRVHYKPGWDCHGLPIELAALKNIEGNLTAKEIRTKAREVASQMSAVQMEAFKDWGVMGDWDNQCYYTYNKDYVVNELLIFWKLLEKGLIYYDLKPVYWSPSSKTALAEAELLYQNHNSLSVITRFETIQNSQTQPLYLLIWTTTPWTLPLNKTVYCSPDLKYSVVKIASYPGSYILATDKIQEFKETLQTEITEQSVISSKEICNLKYRHPWHKDRELDIFESSEVKLFGTGLLHSVPGHGHEDYLMGLKNNLKVECFIDENGCYTPNAGEDLAGLDVLQNGSDFVIERLASDILVQKIYQHSYPYDWRTKQPVIIRACNQWFIDCEQLKERALKSLENVDVPHEFFKSKLQNRPYWCLSRQRKWGVPIPAFFHKISGRPLISKSLIHHICQLFESSGPDVWWTESIDVLFPKKFCDEFFVKVEDIVKSEDIMDIWFDSGVSWSYALNGKKSEIYLEGTDQYSGWFQSSLLTSVAIQNEPSFKKIITHAFVVDEEGKKMSKSLGNVLDPEIVVKGQTALGVDTLRWWVAHRSFRKSIPGSMRILKTEFDNVQKIRTVFRFLLGALKDVTADDLKNCDGLTHLDRYLLNSCYKFYDSTMDHYNSYNIYDVCFSSLNFIPNEVSARYVQVIKDRLYCDHSNSSRRRACQYTINGILDTLCYALAPIIPHLIEEVYSYHPVHGGEKKFFYNKNVWSPPKFWKNNSADEGIGLVDEIKAELKKVQNSPNISEKCCVIQTNESDFELLKKMQNGEEQSKDSELTELLQVAEIQLKTGERKITCVPVASSACHRCRRYTALENEDLCKRCFDLIS